MRKTIIATSVLTLLFISCQKQKGSEPIIDFCALKTPTAKFTGDYSINGEATSEFAVYLNIEDTGGVGSLLLTEYSQSDNYLKRGNTLHANGIKLNSKTYFTDTVYPIIGYSFQSCDVMFPCYLVNDTTGYQFLEKLNEHNYFIDIKTQLKPYISGECDTFYEVRVKGVITEE